MYRQPLAVCANVLLVLSTPSARFAPSLCRPVPDLSRPASPLRLSQGKYTDPQSDTESAWNAELLITQLQKVSSRAALKGLSGYQVASGDERVIHVLVKTLFAEGRRLLTARTGAGSGTGPPSRGKRFSAPRVVPVFTLAQAAAEAAEAEAVAAAGMMHLPSLPPSSSAAPKNVGAHHRSLKKASDKRLAPAGTDRPSQTLLWAHILTPPLL